MIQEFYVIKVPIEQQEIWEILNDMIFTKIMGITPLIIYRH